MSGSSPQGFSIRLKGLFRIVSGATPSPEPVNWNGDIAWATPVDIGRRDGCVIESTDRTISRRGLEGCATEVAPSGSLVLSTRAPIGYVSETRIPMAINQGCRLLVPRRNVESSFYRYVLSVRRPELQALGRGSTFLELSTTDLGDLLVPAPSVEKQRAIVRFVDEQTSKIDALIENKIMLIQRLDEQTSSTVLHRVGGGDQSGPAKTAGLAWLLTVPQHWTIAPLYARYEVKLGKMVDAKRITGTALAPYLSNVNVQWDKVVVENLAVMDFSPEERKNLRLHEGDLLVCEGGEVGRSAMWRGELQECYFQKAVHRLRPLSQRDLPRYFYYVMLAAAKAGHFRAGGNPNTIDHLTGDQLRHYRFPFPPREEQERVALILDREVERIRLLQAKISHAIERLREYRAALITAAVTGQIDVGRVA